MQGIGILIMVVGYAGVYTAYQQGFGPGGSFLYWFTGNAKLGAPSKSQPGAAATSLTSPKGTPGSRPADNRGVLLTK